MDETLPLYLDAQALAYADPAPYAEATAQVRVTLTPPPSVTLQPINPIPEPSTIAIWSLLGLVGLGFGWRKKRKAA